MTLSNSKHIWVTKNSGERAEFSKKKLWLSLEKSGANKNEIKEIISVIEGLLYPGITTKEIYKKAFSLLRKTSRPYAAKYKLKKALLELGPTGFPFEKYLAEVLKHEGFSISVGDIMKGQCIPHEVDIVAKKGNKLMIMECKFHANSRRICDVKIPLYFHSRFSDLEKQWKKNPKSRGKEYKGWIATNTRFSSDAIKYANCVSLNLLGWKTPKKGSLKERIDASGVHPITCLTTLTSKEKKLLLKKMVVLAKDICHDEKKLQSVGISHVRIKKIIKEAKGLCGL
jgi:hypothetical protein